MSINSTMTALANEVRTLSGGTDKLTLDEMTAHTSEANAEIDTQSDLIEQIKTALIGKASGVEPTPTQEKTVDIVENGTVEITPDEGYVLSKVTANVDVTAEGGTGGGSASATVSGINLHDSALDSANTYLSNGVIRDYNGWKSTDFILLEEGKFYVVYCSSTIDLKYCARYTTEKTFKANLNASAFALTTNKTIPYILAGNGNYIRMSGTNSQINALQIYEVINLSWEW